MTEKIINTAEESLAKRPERTGDVSYIEENVEPSHPHTPLLLRQPTGLALGSWGARGNTATRAQVLKAMQQTYGNRAVQRSLPRTPGSPLRAPVVQRFPSLSDIGKGAWNSRLNPFKEPVDNTLRLITGDDRPTVNQMVEKMVQQSETQRILLNNREQILKQYGPGLYSVMEAGLAPIPPEITEMDQRRQEQEHDAAIKAAQMALTGAMPGEVAAEPSDEVYPDLVSLPK